MASNDIQIVAEFIDNASGGINGLANNVEGLEESTQGVKDATGEASGSFLEFNAMLDIAARAAGILKDAYLEIVGTTITYSNEVRTLRDVTGQTAEESSRLLMFFDDFKISAENLTIANRKLAKEGFELNIQTIAQLSDQYLALNDGQERAVFLSEHFGKNSEKFAEVMLLGSDAIMKLNEGISQNLLLTDQSLEQAREYELNLDALQDSWMGLKISIGNEFLPVVNDAISSQLEWNNAMQQAEEITGSTDHRLNIYTAAMLQNQQATENASNTVDSAAQSYMAYARAVEGAADVTAIATAVNAEAVQGAMAVYDQFEKLDAKLIELTTKHTELIAEKQRIIAAEGEESASLAALNEKLAENELAQKNVTEAIKETMEAQLLKTAFAGLDAEGSLALARATGQISEEMYAALTIQTQLKDQYMNGGLTAEEYAQATVELRDAIASLESRGIEITVTTIYEEIGTPPPSGTGYSTGTQGWMTVPSGYDNDTYPIMLSSGERFAVIPEGVNAAQPSGGGMGYAEGGAVNFYLTIQSAVSTADEQHAQSVIFPFIENAVSRLKAEGKL